MTEESTGTLVAQDHGHHPAVLQSAGFSTEHSAQSRSIGYEEEVSPTLRAGVVPAAMAIENHPTDSRVKISGDGKVQTLTERMGTGGGNVPLVAELEPVTMKIRCGKEGGGKGALLQKDKSATLGTNNDQTLFQPSYGIAKEAFNAGEKAAFNFAVNEEVSPTIQATGPGAVAKPDIKAFGVCSKSSHAMLSDNPKAGFYEAKTSRTLDRSGGNAVTSNQGGICIVAPAPEVVAFAQNQRDEVRNLEGKSGALQAQPGMKQQTFVLQGSMIGREEKNGPQGDGVNEDVSFTLNTVDRHAVAAPSGEHYSTSKNSYHTTALREQANTLVATDYKDPPTVNVYHSNHASGMNADFSGNDSLRTLAASDYKDPPTVSEEPMYIVRRLTPVECARLQGFPDWWCDGLAIPDPTDEELAFWTGVWETWRKLNNPDGKPKTEKQLRKWLAQPYTDAAEYKLWGNGISLPIVYFVLSGIAWAAGKEES